MAKLDGCIDVFSIHVKPTYTHHRIPLLDPCVCKWNQSDWKHPLFARVNGIS